MDEQEKKPLFRYEPGELDKTRKNIGFIEADEAKKMVQVLGGEIGLEKSAPVDEKAIRRVRSARTSQDLRSGSSSGRRSGSAGSSGTVIVKTTTPPPASSQSAGAAPARREVLPRLDSKTRGKMDKLMMMPEYGIKTDYGIFNFLNGFRKNGHDSIAEQFASVTLQTYVSRLSAFQKNVRKLISMASKPLQEKIAQDGAPQYKVLKTISNWPISSLESMYKELARTPNNVTVPGLVPITQLIYKLLLSVFFLGEKRFGELMKSVYGEIAASPKVQKEQLGSLLQGIYGDWVYIYQRIPQGMYPLLLRMCSSEFLEFSDLFTKELSKVFNFSGVTKYDILLPDKTRPDGKPASGEVAEEPAAEEEKEESPSEGGLEGDFPGASMGLKLLDRIFPGAGWLELDSLPDMYPFFQPLYHFQDGFNLIPPENPLQVTIILVKIIEDLFEGCRYLTFETDKGQGSGSAFSSESLSTIINEWSDYREIVLEKLYLPNLRDFVNSLYAQRDFLRNQYGKRLMTNLHWHVYYNFLPYIRFEQLLLDKPSNESKVRILPSRISDLVDELGRITAAADAALSVGNGFGEITNIFEPYKFSLPNVVSKRISVLLGAGKKQGTRATNLNLLKYTYAVASVLDWWVNCKTSPAYRGDKVPVCRISAEDDRPIFSVEEREDQNLLFARSIKAMAAKGQEAGQTPTS